MSFVKDEIRIGLIGPSSAGKTSMFRTFHEALDRGRHGFPKTTNPQIRRTMDPTPVEGLAPEDIFARIIVGEGDKLSDGDADALAANIAGTPPDQIVSRHYSLSYVDEHGQRIAVPLTITDAAGEHSFGKNVQSKALHEYRRQLHKELGNCHGFVVVVPFSNAADPSFVRQLETWLTALDQIADEQEKASPALARPRRLVIALTRYDALFTDFGSEALKLAADPAIVFDIIKRLVGVVTNGAGYERNIARFDRSARGGRFEIAFVPTSSFGFVPGFGCVNLDPDVPQEQALGAIRTGSSPGPFMAPIFDYPDQHLFPFLTPDAFIFAAIGLKNSFVVPIDQALNGDLAPNEPARAPRDFGPQQPFQVEGGNTTGKRAKGSPEKETAENDSLRRRFARALKKIDIEL
jgi:hypothetical protein